VIFVSVVTVGARLVCEGCRDALLGDADEATRKANAPLGEEFERLWEPSDA
jgi:hypothetical protein